MQKTTNQKGFTIIEVVLVLAIAGLIFLIVFLALPALQRSQRDTQRRNDLSRFMSQISNYQANNQGAVPTTATSGTGSVIDFRDRYLKAGGDSFSDPQKGTDYAITGKANGSTFSTDSSSIAVGDIYYYQNATCSGESVISSTGGRKIAVVTKLEAGAFYCQNN